MNKSELTRKQKRALTWTLHAQESHIDPVVRKNFIQTIREFQRLLAELWAAETITATQIVTLTDLERKLEKLHSESRYIALRPA
jgi:hypothetical protein